MTSDPSPRKVTHAIAGRLRPSVLVTASLRRGPRAGGTAALAQQVQQALRGARHRGHSVVALSVPTPSPARSDGATSARWAFHGWTTDEAMAVLKKALQPGDPANAWVLDRLATSSVPECPDALLRHADSELALRFDTPVRLPVDLHRDGYAPDMKQVLLSLLCDRCLTLAGTVPVESDSLEAFRVLHHFGRVSPLGAPGSARSGWQFQGVLLLRDASADLVRTLWDLQFSNLVQGHDAQGVAWRGAYRLHSADGPWFDRALLKRPRLALAAHQLAQRVDSPPLVGEDGAVMEPTRMADRLLQRWRQGATSFQASEAFDLHRAGQAPRRVERLASLDLLAQQHLLRLLSPAFERLFHPMSFGFRPGRSREDATAAVRSALRSGFRHVAESDIADCFGSVEHERLFGLVDGCLPRADQLTRALLRHAIAQPYVLEGQRHARSRGLAQGSPLSPLLTNLLLTQLDEAMDEERFRYVRYADDLIVLARSRRDAQAALDRLRATLAGLGLAVAEHKTRVTHLQAGFRFLGEQFGVEALEDQPSCVAAQRKPLGVTEPYLQLGVNGEALEIRRHGSLVGVWPLRRLSQVLVLGAANFSSQLVARCQRLNVPVAVAQHGQRAVSVVAAGQRHFHDQQFAHGLWHAGLSPATRLALAKQVASAKLQNQAALVEQRRGHMALADDLRELRRQIGGAGDVSIVRGLEGSAARMYFAWMRSQIVPEQQPHFAAQRRARGGPDRLNSLLNFAYHLLYARISGFARLMALNPYLGWLHDSEEDYECLVYDLMEPFRPFIDRIVLRLINRRELRPADFDQVDGAWRLARRGTATVVERLEQGLGERVQGIVLRELVWAQVRSLRQACDGRGAPWLFCWNPRDHGDAGAEGQVLTLDTATAPGNERFGAQR